MSVIKIELPILSLPSIQRRSRSAPPPTKTFGPTRRSIILSLSFPASPSINAWDFSWIILATCSGQTSSSLRRTASISVSSRSKSHSLLTFRIMSLYRGMMPHSNAVSYTHLRRCVKILRMPVASRGIGSVLRPLPKKDLASPAPVRELRRTRCACWKNKGKPESVGFPVFIVKMENSV